MENDQNGKGSIIFLDVYGAFYYRDVIVKFYLHHVIQKMLHVTPKMRSLTEEFSKRVVIIGRW